MSRAAAMIIRRGISLTLLLMLGGVLSADLSHFRTGGNSSDNTIFANQRFHVGDGSTILSDIFISCNGLVITDANNASIILPPGANFEFDTFPAPTIGGPNAGLVVGTSFPDPGPIEKTLFINTLDFAVTNNFLVQGLRVQGFTAATTPFHPQIQLGPMFFIDDSAWYMVANDPSASKPGGTAIVTPGVATAPIGDILIRESNVTPTGLEPFNGALWTTTDIRIVLPGGVNVTWDQTATVTTNLPAKVSNTVDYSEGGLGKIARINIINSDFSQNEAVTISGLRLNVASNATDTTFALDVRAGGASNNTVHATIASAVQIQGLPRFTATPGGAVFTVGNPPSGNMSWTVTESAGSPKITAAGDVALNIPGTFDMTWDPAGPAPTAAVSGPGPGAVAAACIIENGNKRLRVDVTNALSAGQSIVVSGARFAAFSGREPANEFIELEIGATGIAGPEAVDTSGFRISQPTIASAADHIFLVNQGASTTINQITITEDATNNLMGIGSTIILRMNGVNVVFGGTNPTLGGNLAGATVGFANPSGGGFLTMTLTSAANWATSSTGTINSIPVIANNPAAVGNFQLFRSGSASASVTSTDPALLVLGSLPTMASAQAQQFTVNDPLDGVLNLVSPITITTDANSSPLFQNGNSLEIVIPAGLNLEWRTSIQPTITGSATGDVAAAVTYPDVGVEKTLRLAIIADWAGNETLTLSNLQFANFSAPCAPPGTSLQLRVRIGGPFAATDTQAKAIGVPAILSNANQIFGINDPLTLMSPIVITEDAATPRIRTGTDIRVRIPAGFNMSWANPLPALNVGTGTGTVGVPSYPTPDILLIPVTANFSVGQTLTISGANFSIGNTVETATFLELLVNGTTNVIPNAFDTATIRIGTRPTLTSIFTGDNNGGSANGSIDRLVLTFSEPIVAGSLSATTGLGFSVTGYNISLAGVGPANVLTLSIAETGQADTNGTPAVTYNPATGDLVDVNDGLELTATPPATQDGASPIIVALTTLDGNSNGRLDEVRLTFSEDLGGTPDIARWILVDADGTTNLLQGLTSANFVISGNVLRIILSDTTGTIGTPRFEYDSALVGPTVLTDLVGNTVPTLTNNTLPVANAGADLSVIPQVVTLDGSASFDPDGAQTLSFSWTEVSRPPGAPAIAFTNGGSSVASFIPTTPGVYVVQLRVTDLIGSSTDTAAITVLNVPPVSDPVFVRSSVLTGSNPFVDGELSTDVNNNLSFGAPNDPLWTVVSRPATSVATITNPNAVIFPGFVPDVPGFYELSYVQRDTAGASSLPMSVFITASNATVTPVAHAGPDIVVPVGTPVTLDSALSWSPTAPTFTWTRPDTTTAASPTLVFTPPGVGLYTFKLTVTAGGVVSAPDTVTVMAYNPANLPPVAFASKLSPSGNPEVGETIQLDATASVEPEGGALTFAWTQLSGPTAALSNPAASQPTFAPARTGVYEFQLVVFDGTQLSFPANVFVQVLNPAGAPVTATPAATGTPASPGHFLSGNPVTLSATVSAVVTNTWWEQVAGPTVTVPQTVNLAPVQFTPTAAGNYTFRVNALDFGTFNRITPLIHVAIDEPGNQAPNALAGPNQLGIAAGSTVTLDGTGSTDDVLPIGTFFWRQVAGPPVALSDPRAAQPTFVPTVGATYVFELVVTDGAASSSPSFVSVTVDPAVVVAVGGGGSSGGCGLTFEPMLLVGLLALLRRRIR